MGSRAGEKMPVSFRARAAARPPWCALRWLSVRVRRRLQIVFDLLTDACFIVRDHNGRALAYVCFDDEKGRRTAAKVLTRNRPGAPNWRQCCRLK